MRRHLRALLIPAILLFFATVAPAEQSTPIPPKSSKKRIAVVSFEAPTDLRTTSVGAGVADMTTTALVQCARFDVIERMQIEKIMAEKKMGELTGNSDVAEVGKLAGVDYLLCGRITELGIREDTGGGLGSILGAAAGVDIKSSAARVALDVRLIECATGKIVVSNTGIGEEKQTGVTITSSKLGNYLSGVSFDRTEWTESRLGRACRKAVDNVVGQVASLFVLEIPILGVIEADGSKHAILSAGNFEGIRAGDVVQIFRVDVQKDADGNVIWLDKKRIGAAKVTEAQNDRSKALIAADAGEVRKGDIAVPANSAMARVPPKPDPPKPAPKVETKSAPASSDPPAPKPAEPAKPKPRFLDDDV